MNKGCILVIDDEAQIRKLLSICLESNDYKVILAENAKEGIHFAASYQPDLILLDLGLPDKSGHEVLKEIKQWFSKAVIILSVQQDETDIVTALDNGASDYLCKPFRTGELLARIRSAIRTNHQDVEHTLISCDELEIDLVARTVKNKGTVVKLTATEYKLLVLLAKNEGRVLTHHYILKEIWGVAYQTETQYLRVFIAQLRKKTEENPNQPKHILTESGIGYRFV